MSETPSTNYSVNQPQTSGSEQSLSVRPFNVTEPLVAKRVCFYKSGDPQFNGVKMVVNSRSFKSFDALLDNLSKRVPLPFGVRNITTPRGIHSINNLEDLEDGKSYICSQQRKVKPINLEMAKKRPLPWQNSRPISARRRAVQLAKEGESSVLQKGSAVRLSTSKNLLVFKNGNVRIHHTIVLDKKNTQSFEAFLDHISEIMQYPVVKLYTTDGRKVSSLQALALCSGAVVAAGREPFRAGNYDPHRYSLPGKLPSNRVHPRTTVNSESRKMSTQIDSSSRSQMFSASSYKGYSNDNNSESSYVPDSDMGLAENHSQTAEDFSLIPSADDIEKYVHLNQDGSMTVEMRVRFNIKEEETIKWTTSVSRASTSTMVTDPSSELNILTSRKAIEGFSPAEDGISLQQVNTEVTNQDTVCGTETNNYDIWQNPMSTDVSQTKSDNAKPKFYRPPTPGPRRVRQKKAMVESVTVVSDTEVKKKLVGQFSYSEETDNCETTSEYCVVTHASSKTTNVINPELSEVCSSHGLKQMQTNHMEEERLTTDTTRRSVDLADENSSLKNVLDVEEGLSNGVISGCDSNISRAHSSFEHYYATGQNLPNQSGASRRKATDSLEPYLSKNEGMLCNQCKELYSSQVSVHPPSPESDKLECTCTQANPENDSAETMTATQLSDGSQATSSGSKKKKKKKKKIKSSGDTKEHDISLKGINENEVQTSKMRTRKESAQQRSSSKITVHKGGIAFSVDDVNKTMGTEEDLYNQVSEKSPKSEPAPNPKKNIKKQLPKLKSKTDKKHHVPPSAKNKESQLSIKNKSKNETEPIKEGDHETATVIEDTPSHFISSTPLVETESGETDNGNIPSQKLSLKHRKVKKNKKSESELGSKTNTSDEGRMSGPLRHSNLTEEITEHTLENYVQSWLQNIFPDTGKPDPHLAPIYSSDRRKHQLSIKSFSEKDIRLSGKNVCTTQNDIINDRKQSNSMLNKLSEIEAVEESVKKLYDRHIGCLRDANASLIEQVKHQLQSDIPNAKTPLSNSYDTKKAPLEADEQRQLSEICAQVRSKGINNLLGPDIQKDCLSSLLLLQLKSAILTSENKNTGCVTRPGYPADISSPSLLCSSSNVLVAWLLLLNLKESLFSINKDDIAQSTCRCSEILTLLQYLKQVAIKEEADDLKSAVSNMEDCTTNCLILSVARSETQEPLCCQENNSVAEIKDFPDPEEQEKLNQNLILNDTVDSKDIEAEEELYEEVKASSEVQNNDFMLAENPAINGLELHNGVQDLTCTSAQLHNVGLTSNEEPLKENDDLALLESQKKHTDTSINNEESELSEEPNSTSHTTGSQDRDHIFDLETSELDEKELNTEEKKYTESLWEKENSSGYPTSAAENAATDRLEDSIQEGFDENGACDETSERLSVQSPLSFCYESKQLSADACEEEPTSRVKLLVKELECGSHSSSAMEFKPCLKSPATSDLSDYRPETDESFNNARPSSDLTNESADEAMYEKEYNKGYVKRTIERLYGKAEASFKPGSKTGPPYLAHTQQKDTAETFHTLMETAPSFSEAYNMMTDENMPFSRAMHEIPDDLNKTSEMWEKENAALPAPQFSLNGDEAYCHDDCSVQYTNQHNQSQGHTAEDEGILIDKGKWLLKENHLIRRSPPENTGMCGNTDTSSDTILDNHSDDIPYSHFGNLDQHQPPLKEISSSELEDMAKPCDSAFNYFNMPHNSDSEVFADASSLKSKNSQNGSHLLSEAASKICTTSTQMCAEGNPPAFTAVEFRLPDNKVHPLQQSPNDEPIQSQPNSNANTVRNRHEDQDSLDKLHAICGQHCPILTAIIKATNEEIRGCAYRKATDVENQVGLHLSMGTTPFGWQGKNLIWLDKNLAQLKSSSINKIANILSDRYYADNTLDFVNDNTFRLLLSLKESQGLKKSNVTENVNVNPQEIHYHECNATKEALNDAAVGLNNNASAFQNSRRNADPILGENPAPSSTAVREDCKGETLYYQGMFLNNTDRKIAVNLEDENVLNSQEETLTYEKEQENGNEYSES